MGYERVLNEAINGHLNRLQAEGQPWQANWIAHAICREHEPELDGTAEFWRHTGYATTRDAVRRAINARAGDKVERESAQAPLLPGYNHLQSYYVVKRRGVGDIGVPIGLMTDREIDGKITRYEAMSVACRDHADELRDFKKSRRAAKRKQRRAA